MIQMYNNDSTSQARCIAIWHFSAFEAYCIYADESFVQRLHYNKLCNAISSFRGSIIEIEQLLLSKHRKTQRRVSGATHLLYVLVSIFACHRYEA